MLKISLDEAYVFDYLSIQEVKLESSTGYKRDIIKNTLDILISEITQQIGDTMYAAIKDSIEYELLKDANKKVFVLVDRSSESPLSKETADANYHRYVCKIELQKRFFTSELKETKL